MEEHINTDKTPYLCNGKELDEETGLCYYGARYYDARTSVFTTVDRFAEKYNSMSPCHYALNNPLGYAEINGDSSINFLALMRYDETNGINYTERAVDDLKELTGLSLSIDSKGELKYAKNSSGAARVSRTDVEGWLMSSIRFMKVY